MVTFGLRLLECLRDEGLSKRVRHGRASGSGIAGLVAETSNLLGGSDGTYGRCRLACRPSEGGIIMPVDTNSEGAQ